MKLTHTEQSGLTLHLIEGWKLADDTVRADCAAILSPVADGIRGPLRDQDRQDCMAYAASLGIRREDADALIRSAAAKAYVNGHKDAAFEPAAGE